MSNNETGVPVYLPPYDSSAANVLTGYAQAVVTIKDETTVSVPKTPLPAHAPAAMRYLDQTIQSSRFRAILEEAKQGAFTRVSDAKRA